MRGSGAIDRGVVRRQLAAAVAVAAVATVGLTAAAIDAPRAQPAVSSPAEIVSRRSGASGGPFVGESTRPSISTLGDRVAFSTVDEARFGEFLFPVDIGVVRDRIQQTTLPGSLVFADVAALSDNGCVVAMHHIDANFTASASVQDICTGESWGIQTPTTYAAGVRAGVNADGSTVAFAYRGQIRIHRRANGYVASEIVTFDSGAWTAFDVALSADGSRVAVVAQPVIIGFRGVPAAQEALTGALFAGRVSDGVVSQVATSARATSPSWDAGGSLLAYSDDVGVKVYQVGNGQSTLVVPRAYDPHLSRDGRHLVYVEGFNERHVYAATRLGSSWSGPVDTQWVSAGPSATSGISSRTPATSEHGRWVAWSTNNVGYLGLETAFSSARQVVVRERRPVLTVGSHDYGTVTSPALTTIQISNTGPSGWRLSGIDVTAGFSLLGHNCPLVIHPGGNCQANVRFDAGSVGATTGSLVVRDQSYPGVPLEASGRLRGSVSPPPDPGGGSTTTSTTVPGRGSGTPDPGAPALRITPSPVVFGPVVLGGTPASTTADADVVNDGDAATTIQSVVVAGDDFTIVDDGCDGVALGPGERCTVELRFAPATIGQRTGTITAAGTGGAVASGRLLGGGDIAPVLAVTPEIARGGEVVRITGERFLPDSVVDLVIGAASTSVATDAAGGFVVSALVLDGTPEGIVEVDDVAVPGATDAEPVEFRVVAASMQPRGGSGVPTRSPNRRYLSR